MRELIEQLVFCQLVVSRAAATSKADTAVAVIWHDHDRRLAILTGELQKLGRHADRVIRVRGPIHLAALHHQEETVRIFRELLDRQASHLLQRRLRVRITIQVIIHLPVAIQGPHLIRLVGSHAFQIVAINIIAIGFQIGLLVSSQQRYAATDHDRQVVVRHLRSDPLILAAVITVRRAVGRCSVRKLASENQSRCLSLQDLARLENGCQRLESPFRIGRVNIVIAITFRIGRHVARAARLTRHITRGCRGGIANRRVRGMRTHGSAKIGINEQVRLGRILIPLQPTGD